MEKQQYRTRVYCRKCKNENKHYILAKHTIGEEDSEWNYYWTEDYMIVECMGCETVTFIKEYDDPSLHFFHPEEDVHIDIDDITIYPPKPLTNKDNHYDIIDFQHLPELLKELYRQVIANYQMKYYLMAAAGLRMIIEGICNDLSIKDGYVTDEETGKVLLTKDNKQVRSGNLNGRINGLAENGILAERQTVILHIIRKLGNQTVHKLNNPSGKIIVEGLEIVEHTFRNIYELKKYDTLKDKYLKNTKK
ncbi:DUF4145 domain-containing protein [Fictibacillus nanhaiensis]|uniref:DUF4145 domain-containing protein n=1 Tax=Fictibacillus nanhaiensis TaxID=742169 RepID=A0ABS2ZTU7_9BACL|nr:DUF4145 domain-containing protein [Fictibacillus nanhaiensis]